MVKIARPCRQISIGDTLNVYFTACSIIDGELVLWGQLLDIDNRDGDSYATFHTKIIEQIPHLPVLPINDVRPGDNYLIRYKFDNQWYRGLVMDVTSTTLNGKVWTL